MTTPMAFQPEQITHYQAEHLNELQGDVSETAIKYSLSLLPPFAQGDVIHDNACGTGAVTEAIMALDPPTIHIDATDLNPQFVQGCAALAETNNWPVSTAVMSAQDLGFPDNRFTHSFTNFAFHCLGDHDRAAREVYRTLAPGGVAVASVWAYMPHVDALQHAHWQTRGRDGPMPSLLPIESFKEAELRRTLKIGGFESEKINIFEKECFLVIPDLERWAQLAWSYLGKLPSGWSEEDEINWDKALATIVKNLQTSGGTSRNEKGELVIRMVACIAVARK